MGKEISESEQCGVMISELVEQAVRAVLDNRREEALEKLQSIDYAHLVAQREIARDRIWKNPAISKQSSSSQGKAKREPVSAAVQRATFERDRFTCRYAHCRRRTIHLPVLKALSALFPEILTYHPNWKPLEKHILYWTYSTSLEHKVSFPEGGTSDPDNLITTCYQCNDLKNKLRMDELGWEVTEPAQHDWDGLDKFTHELKKMAKARTARSEPPIAVERKPERVPVAIDEEAQKRNNPIDSFKEGYFIRAMLPGKKSRRQYRVDSIMGTQVALTEMWRQDSDRTWVASRKQQVVAIDGLSGLEVVRAQAPEEGSFDDR